MSFSSQQFNRGISESCFYIVNHAINKYKSDLMSLFVHHLETTFHQSHINGDLDIDKKVFHII